MKSNYYFFVFNEKIGRKRIPYDAFCLQILKKGWSLKLLVFAPSLNSKLCNGSRNQVKKGETFKPFYFYLKSLIWLQIRIAFSIGILNDYLLPKI